MGLYSVYTYGAVDVCLFHCYIIIFDDTQLNFYPTHISYSNKACVAKLNYAPIIFTLCCYPSVAIKTKGYATSWPIIFNSVNYGHTSYFPLLVEKGKRF